MAPGRNMPAIPSSVKNTLGINGTGHGDFVTGAQHKLVYVFHTHFSDSKVSPRKTAAIKMSFVKDGKRGVDNVEVDKRSFRYIVT
jgi:hypothetical protein